MSPPGITELRWDAVASSRIAERAEALALIGAQHGLAYAFPLLDRRVVEFALTLPNEFFLREGIGRRPFRDAMRDLLPEPIYRRHDKRQIAPSRGVDLAGSRLELLEMIERLEKNEAVRRVIDLNHLKQEIEKFPPPEVVYESLRQGVPHPEQGRMLAVGRALLVGVFIEQHGDA